jgi:diacylglycerol kinase (ATP)
MQNPQVHVLSNRNADEVTGLLQAQGCDVVELAAFSMVDSIQAIEDAIAAGAVRVIVIGGDGMMHAAANAVGRVGAKGSTATTIGLVPVGSGNDFATAMGIPVDDVAQAVHIALGPGRPIDLLQTTHGWVASVATCGFPARVNARANMMKWPKGPAKYTLATLALIRTLRADRVTVMIDPRQVDPRQVDAQHADPPHIEARHADPDEYSLIAIGNTAFFGGGMKVCPNATPDDGTLDVTLVRKCGRVELLRYLPTIFSGSHLKHPKTAVHRATTVRLESKTAMDLWGDGEYLGPLPVTINVVPRAMNFANSTSFTES